MMRLLGILIAFVYIISIMSCGSSKEELNLENETAESMLQKSDVSYQNGNYKESARLAQLLLDHFPTSDLHIEAQLLIARNLGAMEEYEQQFDLLLRVLKENIIPEKVPVIYAQIAAFYENSARWNPGTVTSDSADFTKAAEFYRKAVFYPNSKDEQTKSMALYRMALMHAKLNEIEIASKAYEEVIATYPASPYSSLARTKLANPANTEELPLPTATGTASVVSEMPRETQPEQKQAETVPVAEETIQEAPEQIELPPDDTDESSILDSLQTIDQDEPESDEE